MKKFISLILAALLVLSTLTTAFAATYTDKDTVKKVQQALNDAGYNCGTPDGVAGKKTAVAITQYRTDKGLEVSDTIDDALLEAMGLAEAEPVQPTTDQEQEEPVQEEEALEEEAPEKAEVSEEAEAAPSEIVATGKTVEIDNTWPALFTYLFDDFAQTIYSGLGQIENVTGDPLDCVWLDAGNNAVISDTSEEGVYQISITGEENMLTMLCYKKGDDYHISKTVYTLSTEKGDTFVNAVLLPSVGAYMYAAAGFFSNYKEDMSGLAEGSNSFMEAFYANTDWQTEWMNILQQKLGMQGGFDSLSLDGWDSDYATEQYSIHFERDGQSGNLVFIVTAA